MGVGLTMDGRCCLEPLSAVQLGPDSPAAFGPGVRRRYQPTWHLYGNRFYTESNCPTNTSGYRATNSLSAGQLYTPTQTKHKQRNIVDFDEPRSPTSSR